MTTTLTTLSNARPLTDIMQDAMRLEEAAKAVPYMVRYCIMAANERRQNEDDKAPSLRDITKMSKGDKSKQLSFFSSLLLGYSNTEELKTALAEAAIAVKADDDMATVIKKENTLITVDQFDAARSRIGREVSNAAAMEDLLITSASYDDMEQAFFLPTAMFLAPGMVAHGRLLMADTHPVDGKAANVMINALPYEIKLSLDYLTFIAHMRNVIIGRKELPDSPLARVLAKANGLRHIGQAIDKPDDATNGSNVTPPVGDTPPTDDNATPPAPPTPDEHGTTARGAEETPPAHQLPHYRKLVADFNSAAFTFHTECAKIARFEDTITDDFDPHWKDFVNTLAKLNMMKDIIIETTARVDAEHAATTARNMEEARAKAFEKAPVSHTRGKSNDKKNAAVDKAKTAA